MSFQRSLCVGKLVWDRLPVCKGAGGTISFVSGAMGITAAPEDADLRKNYALYKSQCLWLIYSIFFLLLFLEAVLNSYCMWIQLLILLKRRNKPSFSGLCKLTLALGVVLQVTVSCSRNTAPLQHPAAPVGG